MKKTPSIKDSLKADLPKCFKVSISKTGHTVFVSVKAKYYGRDEAFTIVNQFAKKNKLEEVNHGTCIPSGDMDWELVNKDIEKKLVKDANQLLNRCKAFFKTWNGNEYCNSDRAYEKIEKIRALFESELCLSPSLALFETDEN